MIRVIVADDSSVMRTMVSNLLDRDPEISVVDVARNGLDAYNKVLQQKPDVLILDMIMGEYDGIYAIEKIMREVPTPIIVLSATGNNDKSTINKTIELGALDFINKPEKNRTKVSEIEDRLIKIVKEASKANIKSLAIEAVHKQNQAPHSFEKNTNYEVIVIGSSTGGPSALDSILSNLPSNLLLPVIIVQHMPENFITSFAERLNNLSTNEVLKVKENMILEPGKIYIAGGRKNWKLMKSSGKIKFTVDHNTYREYNFPSINATMLSVAEIFGNKTIGIILTGMGRDGAKGMKKIKEIGGLTIAQNKQSSVVYGMPKEAVLSNAVCAEMHLKDIPGYVISSL